MSSALLQIIALITMTIDHVGYRLCGNMQLMRAVGRLAFPIFAFLLVEGFLHTSNRKKYAVRLAIFAVISEIPFELFAYGSASIIPNGLNNVFFTLLLAFFAMMLLEKGEVWTLGAVLMAALAELIGCDYGSYGVLLILCFYFFRDKRPLAMLSLVVLTLLFCLSEKSLFQLPAILAVLPLMLYNGKRGYRLPKYFSYIYYPAHLLIISLIGKYIL